MIITYIILFPKLDVTVGEVTRGSLCTMTSLLEVLTVLRLEKII